MQAVAIPTRNQTEGPDELLGRVGAFEGQAHTEPGGQLALSEEDTCGLEARAVRTILVCTDFSSAGNKAVERAVGIARQCQAALAILHVIDINSAAGTGTAEDWMRHLREEGVAGIRQLDQAWRGQVEARTELAEGLPWEVIVEQSADFDLLVLGRTCARKRRGLFPRHTIRRVVENAACPVLVVPQAG